MCGSIALVNDEQEFQGPAIEILRVNACQAMSRRLLLISSFANYKSSKKITLVSKKFPVTFQPHSTWKQTRFPQAALAKYLLDIATIPPRHEKQNGGHGISDIGFGLKIVPTPVFWANRPLLGCIVTLLVTCAVCGLSTSIVAVGFYHRSAF